MMRFGWASLVLLVAFASGAAAQDTASRPPNVVLILADDLGYADLGVYGATDIATPHLDRLAADGVRFTAFYANAPVCTPTRTALLTGRYPQRPGGLEQAIGLGGVGRYDDAVRLAERGELGLPPEYAVLPGLLAGVGYATALIGKWHLGHEPAHSPVAHGFDYSIGPIGGAVDYFHHTEPVGEFLGVMMTGERDFVRNGEPQDRSGVYLTDLLAHEAVAWLNRQRPERPFFLYVPFTAPHTPYQGPGDYRPERMHQDDWNTGSREAYAAMVEALDRAVGEILDQLDAMGEAEDTVVIFCSDNGPARWGDAGPFARGKGTTFEGGIRVPAIVRWPGRVPAGVVSDQTAITMDLTASILRLAGAPAPERPLDGIDLLAHVEAGAPAFSRTLYWRTRRHAMDRRAVREGDLKYVYDRNQEGLVNEYLFDLAADPGESRNLADADPETFARLKAMLAGWMATVRAER